jgi:ABC-type uncharacterized transport systems, ATPase components
MAGMMIGAQELTKSPARIGQFGARGWTSIAERARRCRPAGAPRCLLDHPGGRDRRDRGGLRQRSAPAGRGARRPARGERGRDSHCRRALPRHARGDASPQALLPAGGAAQERVRRPHERGRQFGVPRFRSSAARRRRAGGCQHGKFREQAERGIASYQIKTRSPDTPIGELSGGNVQRTVLARELGGEVDVMIAANPCFGLDSPPWRRFMPRSSRCATAAPRCCW